MGIPSSHTRRWPRSLTKRSCRRASTSRLLLRKWETLNPNRLTYQMIFTDTDTVAADALRIVQHFVEEPCR